MSVALFAQDDGGFVVFLLIVLFCIAASFLEAAEKAQGSKGELRSCVIGAGIAVGLLVFFRGTWVGPAPKEQELQTRFALGVAAGLLATLAFAFLLPVAVFLCDAVLLPCWHALAWIVSSVAAWKRQTAKTAAPSSKATTGTAAATASQLRRDKARAECELFYLRNPDLEELLPREKFEQFVTRFMGDTQPPEVVEDNGKQLLEIMRGFTEKAAGSLKGVTIADRAKELQEQILQISSSSIGEREKESLIALLKRQFMAGLQKEIEP